MKHKNYISPSIETEELCPESALLNVSDIYNGELGVRASSPFDTFEAADETGTVQGIRQVMNFMGLP